MKRKPEITIKCLKVVQPIGEFFIANMNHLDVINISYSDVRRIEDAESEFESYLGIQRELSSKRVGEISKYVKTIDACFPTSVILAIPEECIEYDEKESTITIKEFISDDDRESIPFDKIAKILDGQHRLAGLENLDEKVTFDINVSIFIGADIADQATIFSSVNLAQTKVNKSLSYDLYDLAKKRSPQRTAHKIVVALNNEDGSPFHLKIKRLGTSTRTGGKETLTQATFINMLLNFVSSDPIADRDALYRAKKLSKIENPLKSRTIFRNFFIDGKDLEIAKIIWNYFLAIEKKWPEAWDDTTNVGSILSRTNGFKAFMRLLRDIYISMGDPDKVPKVSEFSKYVDKIVLKSEEFTTANFKPGSSGESHLYKEIYKSIFQ